MQTRHRCRSLGASELRDLLEEDEGEKAASRNEKRPSQDSTTAAAAAETSFGVLGKSEPRRLKHVYPSRLRSKSSSCDKQVPADVDEARVLPLHHPGIS